MPQRSAQLIHILHPPRPDAHPLPSPPPLSPFFLPTPYASQVSSRYSRAHPHSPSARLHSRHSHSFSHRSKKQATGPPLSSHSLRAPVLSRPLPFLPSLCSHLLPPPPLLNLLPPAHTLSIYLSLGRFFLVLLVHSQTCLPGSEQQAGLAGVVAGPGAAVEPLAALPLPGPAVAVPAWTGTRGREAGFRV